MNSRIVDASDNLFEDLGFDPAEATNLAIRSDLMSDLRERIQGFGWSPQRAAEVLRIEPSSAEALLQGHVDRFRIDDLVDMLARCGASVRFEVSTPAAA